MKLKRPSFPNGDLKRVLCPVCRHERWVRLHDVYRLSHVTQIALVTLLMMAVLFPVLDTKIILIPVPLLLLWEFIRNVINRIRLMCPRCDYDPALYRVSRVKARERCEKRLVELKTSQGPTSNVKVGPKQEPTPLKAATPPNPA